MRQDYDGGKYTVIFDRETGELRADRNGEAWRDLSGDKLVYCMLAEHAAAQQEIARLRAALERLKRVADLARSEWHMSGDIYGAMKRLEDELSKP